MGRLGFLKALVDGIFAMYTGARDLDDKLKDLDMESDYLGSTVADVKQQSSSDLPRQGKKRKIVRVGDPLPWVVKADQVLELVQRDVKRFRKRRYFLMPSQTATKVQKKIEALADLQKQGALLLRRNAIGIRGPRCTSYIPVKDLIGQVASAKLQMLQGLLQDPNAGRIAIHGKPGMGKTLLMKHLLNWASISGETFTNLLWVTLADHFGIREIQDAVASVVQCDLSGKIDLMTRAASLSCALAGIGNFVLFLDGVPDCKFSLEDLGIPIPIEGSLCKLVLTTNSNSVSEMLECAGKVELCPILEQDAYQLFLHDALLDAEPACSLEGLPRVLAELCNGVPRTIESRAISMRGIIDTCEWRHAADTMKKILRGEDHSVEIATDELQRDKKRMKKEVAIHSSSLSETNQTMYAET